MQPDRSTPPPVLGFPHLVLPKPVIYDISPAMRLHVIEAAESRANRVSVFWNYGSNRTQGQSTATELVPQMIMQGTSTMSAEEITDRIDFTGSFTGTSAGGDYTSVECLSLNAFTPEMLDILFGILTQPVFPADRFEAIRRKVINNFELKQTKSDFRAKELLAELLAGAGHPYFRTTTYEDIAATTIEQVRNCWHEGIHNTRIDVFACGRITGDIEGKIVDFARNLSTVQGELSNAEFHKYHPEEPGRRYISMPDARQSAVAIGIPVDIDRSHPDYIPLRIAVTGLGGYFGSRLMSSIREEQGLTYGISAWLAGAPEGTSIQIAGACDAAYVEAVIEQTNIEIRKMAEAVMPEDEFNRLCSYYMTTLASVKESFITIGKFYESQLTVGIPDNYFDEQQHILRELTPQKLRDVAAKYFLPECEITVVAGRHV